MRRLGKVHHPPILAGNRCARQAKATPLVKAAYFGVSGFGIAGGALVEAAGDSIAAPELD
jgi:hypothetical protein